MTTRNPALPRSLPLLLPLLLAGCATRGPNRGYYLTSGQSDRIVTFAKPASHDADRPDITRQDSMLRGFDIPLAMAYDPFTDHFFIRLNPGQRFLVVDRPGRRVKRAFEVTSAELPSGVADIAIRSRDRHLFIANPSKPALIETDLDGVFQREITLPDTAPGPVGVAYDQANNRLLTLSLAKPDEVQIRGLDGGIESTIRLDRPVARPSIAFDSVAREIYAVVKTPEPSLGVFSSEGRLRGVEPLPEAPGIIAFDVGPHSFLRLF